MGLQRPPIIFKITDFPLSRRNLLGYDQVVKSGQEWRTTADFESFSGENSTEILAGLSFDFGRSSLGTQADTMFRGNHPARVDEKGRLKLPAEFKRQIEEQYGTQFYITSKDGRVAEIHPLQEWEKVELKLAAIPNFNPAKKKLLDRLNYYGQMTEIDAQGRVLLPQILRESAKLAGDVVVFGMQTYLEVANREAFKQNMDQNPLTPEDEQSLAGFGL